MCRFFLRCSLLYKQTEEKTTMKKLVAIFMITASSLLHAQTYDSTTLVDTNNNSTSTSTVTSTNTNNNINNNINDTTVNSTATNNNVNTNTSTSTSTNINTNINNSTSTSTNNNNNLNTSTSTNTNLNTNNSTSTSSSVIDSTSVNTNNNNNTSTSTNVNTNVNNSTSTSTSDQRIDSNNKNDNYNRSDINQKIESPPPSAIAPSMMSGGNSDLCTTGVSGAIQTQILGIAGGGTIRDLNCERLKLSKTLFDMGMKVAAVATMCQDRRVWDAMMAAGTPCPIDGRIGEAARVSWNENADRIPQPVVEKKDDTVQKVGSSLGFLALLLFLL
jgi:hypothetical protein